MNGSFHNGVVRLGGEARQRFYDSRGYGFPDNGDLVLAPTEAAHLLYRGDLDAVDGQSFPEFLASRELGIDFLVYRDLRERGFYLSPARDPWLHETIPAREDFVVYPRGQGPTDGEVAYYVRCVGERDSLAAEGLGECVLAVVDEDGDRSYFESRGLDAANWTDQGTPNERAGSEADGAGETNGTNGTDGGNRVIEELNNGELTGRVLTDRVLVADPPTALYERGFYGRPLEGAAVLGLSLLEGAFLAAKGVLTIREGEATETIIERGRAVEGDRFDRRLRVYRTLREAGVVPKTGFKFGADFRTYNRVESVGSLGHSERLVRVVPSEHVFSPRDLALDVRLAGGVRKEMVFALVGETELDWLSVARLTP